MHQAALATEFLKAGATVEMLVPRAKISKSTSIPNYVVETPSLNRLGLPASCDSLGQIPGVVARCLRQRPDAVYIRADTFSWAPAAAARMFGCRVVMEHNGWLASERRLRGGGRHAASADRICQVLCARVAHASRTVTSGLRRLLVTNGIDASKVHVIGNGTNTGKFFPINRAEALKELNWQPEPIRLGFIGGLAAWHGVSTAIHAFRLLQDDVRLRLVIAGDGPQRQELEALAQRLGVSGRVDFLGYVPQDRANIVINSFDIAIAPFTAAYTKEIGLSSIKIRDYAAAGRTVVASRIEGVEELAEHGWLSVHNPDDPEDLARIIQQSISGSFDPTTPNHRARAYAENHFAWEKIASEVLNLIIGK